VTDRICVAQIGAAHGIRGEVRLRSFTENPAAIADYGPLESEDGAQRFTIEALRPAKDHFVVRLAGVSDRTAAEKLANLKLYISRDRLPPIEDDDTYYHADLVGLAAVSPDGRGDPLMLPFTEAAVPEVDVKAGRIVVATPAVIE
jgi:16S rRNA processing protein RimM